MVEKGGSVVIVNVCDGGSGGYIAISNMEGGVCVKFGNDSFYFVDIRGWYVGELYTVMNVGDESSTSVGSSVLSDCSKVG